LRIKEGQFPRAQSIVQDHLKNDLYIKFATEEDWVAFYGQPRRRPSGEEALSYYRRRGSVEDADRAFRTLKQKGAAPGDLEGLVPDEFRELQVFEKTIEDFLELNLQLLEEGLRFIRRQYPTSTGPLDILARDSRGRWVVIELKKGQAADRVIGQLLRYRSFIIREKGPRCFVRGFIVARSVDPKLVAAAEGAKPVPVEVFRFAFRGTARRMYPVAKDREKVQGSG
jgi:hypothetical protein